MSTLCQTCEDRLRCDVCDDRMCSDIGPEPRACGTTCGDCPCDCTACRDARWDVEIDAAEQIRRDAEATS